MTRQCKLVLLIHTKLRCYYTQCHSMGRFPAVLSSLHCFPVYLCIFHLFPMTEKRGKGKNSGKYLPSLGSLSKQLQQPGLKTRSSKFYLGLLILMTRIQVIGPKFTAFPGMLARIWIRSKIAETQSGSQNTGVTNDALTCHATTPS